MHLSEICVKRPVFATVMSLMIILFGTLGYIHLAVREFPNVDFPIVTIKTSLPGANPQIIEEEVSDVIEEEISTIEGIKQITSRSLEGNSLVTIEFNLDRDIDIAAQDVRDKISRIRKRLPSDIEEPSIEKLDLNAKPIMWIAVSGEGWLQSDLSHYSEKKLKEKIQKVKGVGSVIIGGEKRYAVRIWLDTDKLYSRGLTIDDVGRALRERNVELPSGRIEGINREFSVKTNGEIESVEAFNELIITYKEGVSIKIKDIAYVESGVENERTLSRFKGKPAIGLGILKQSEANTISVAQEVKKTLEELKKTLPKGVETHIAFDSSVFVQKSIDEVKETLIIAGLLVLFTIFFFLRNLRSTFIPSLAMPISVVTTFALMYFLGFTLNNFTLLALVLSIGIVVDDAIVMLENIYRRMEEGEGRFKASIVGSREITFAIVAASFALIAVFLPVAFMDGIVGRFFYEFGISVSAAVIISAFVALTMTPMLCSRFLKYEKKHSTLYNFLEKGYIRLEDFYKNLLKLALNHRFLVLIFALFSLFIGLVGFALLNKEFIPVEDRGSFVITLEAPEGSTLEYTDKYLREIENFLANKEEVQSYFSALALSMVGGGEVNKGILFVSMVERSKRRSQEDVMNEIRQDLSLVTGVNAFVVTLDPFAKGMQNRNFEYILTAHDFNELQSYSKIFTDALKKKSGFIEVDSDLEINKPELMVVIDREKAASLGISIRSLSKQLNTLLAGKAYSKFKSRGERYDVILQIPKKERLTPDIINRIYMRSENGDLLRLGNFIQIIEGVGPSVINHYEKGRSVKISANLDGITLNEAVGIANDLAKKILPKGFETLLTGQAQNMKESFSSLIQTFLLAVLIIYLILAAQFESFISPLIIMGALPLSMIGAFGGLLIFHMTLNIYSLIGIIMLMGLVTKNSILLVDYTNQLRARGVEINEAIQEAGRVRLRPILMTAFSTIFGIIPIALSLGAGAESRRPMGVAVIGGMFTSTLLTLIIIPVLYSFVDSLLKGFFKKPHNVS